MIANIALHDALILPHRASPGRIEFSGTTRAALAPLNKSWTKLGVLPYRIVSPVVMAFLFYVIVTPMGLLMRMLGKDTLRLRRDPDAASYWIHRTPLGPAPESMKNQF